MISNCGHDENNSYAGGKAGDQGGEWVLRSWYNRPWDVVLRHPNAKVRNKIAQLAKAAAENDKIGYDQSQRYTFWQQLQASGYDPVKIQVPCEADCSSGVAAIVKATGYLLGITKLKNVSIYLYTGNMKTGLSAAGFQILTGKKYTESCEYLLPGDILLNEAHHVATNITKGPLADTVESNAGKIGQCTVQLKTFLVGASDNEVRAIQRILNSLGYRDPDGKQLEVDGELGERTAYAITKFQKDCGMQNINYGTVAVATWKKLLNAL